ncbi:uncharacterized protein LOC131952976 isoform X2 [Physella acuta]|uniref:uncharacterized protein LOC131952976 isoform X2 n=1 Tax=Physella acuta TaxID=109671 RepID=UPI0027DC6B84|nr:uncharacterized protein LOC131952976 isoform X2 [Physella acuta]
MLNLDDDGYSTSECGPQHSTPIKPQCFQYPPALLHGSYTSYSSNKTSAMVTGRHSRVDNSRNTNHQSDCRPSCAECLSDSDVCSSKKTVQHAQCLETSLAHSQEVLLEKMKSTPGSRFFLDSCPTDKEVSVSDKKSTAIFLEQDIINKQRHEIQILMEELGTRDQELNDLVASHQRQVQAWEVERDKFQMLQSRLNSYQDELISNDQQLKETLAEMSRVNEQREADAKEFKRTQNEMEKLAERIKENSHYIKEMEFQNKSLNATIKDLMAERKSWEEREAELLKDMDEKDCQLSERRAEWKNMKDHIEFLQARCDELEEKNLNLSTEAGTWKKKYCNAKDDADKLFEEVTIKEENIQKMTQQLHESLQQAIALQKALFTSCEREKCKEEVMYSLRKQHKRTMQELQNIRELYDRQNRDLTLYHLSVREAHETKQKETEENQRQKDEKKSWVSVEEEKVKREEKYRRDKNMSSHKDRLGPQESECSYLLKQGRGQLGSDTQLDVQTERSGELSISACHTVRCHNVATITSSTTQLSDDSQQGRSRGRNCLSSSYAENISRNATDKRCSSDSRSTSSQKPKKKVTRSRTTSPILTRKCSPQKDKPVGQKAVASKSCQRPESSSDASHLTSPSKFDDDLTPADSDGMCHELKRDISHIGKENFSKQQSKSSSNSWRKSALSDPNKPSFKSLSNLWDAPANPKRSSFLKKDRVEKRISFSAEDEDTQNSPGGGVEKVSSDVARRVEDSGYGTARNPSPPPTKSPATSPSHEPPVSPSYIHKYSQGKKNSDHKHSNQDGVVHTSSSIAKYSDSNKPSDHKHSHQDGVVHTSSSIAKYSDGNKPSDHKHSHQDGVVHTSSSIAKYSDSNKPSDHKHSNQDGVVHTSSSIAKYSDSNKPSDHKHSHQDGVVHTSSSIAKYSDRNKPSDHKHSHQDGVVHTSSSILKYSDGIKTSDHKHSNQDGDINSSPSYITNYSEGIKTSDHKRSNQDGDINTSPSYIPNYSEGNITSRQDVRQHSSPSTTRKLQGLAGRRSPCAKSKSPSQDGSLRKSSTEIKKRTCCVCKENRSPKERKKQARCPAHRCQCHAKSSNSDEQSAPDREISLCLTKSKKKVLEDTPEEIETRKLSSYAMMVPGYIHATDAMMVPGYIHATERKASIDRNTSPLIMMSPSVSRKEVERPSTVDLSELTSTSYELKDRPSKKLASKSHTAVKKVSYMDQLSPPTDKSSVSERLDVSPMVLMNCPRSKEVKQHKRRRRKSQSPIAGFPPRKGKMKITVEYSDEDENSSEVDEKREVCKCQKKSKSCCEFARAYKRRSSKPDTLKSHGIYSCSDGLGDSLYCQKLYKPGRSTLLDDKLRFCSDLRRSYPDSSRFDPYRFKAPKVDPFLGQQTYASKLSAIPSDVGTYLSLYCNNNKSQDSQSDVGCHSNSQSEADCHSNNSSQKEITKATQQTSGHLAQHVISPDGLNAPEGVNLDPSVGTKQKLSNPSTSADTERETPLSQPSLGQSAGGPSSTERNLGQSAGGPSSTERNLGQSAGGPSSTERNLGQSAGGPSSTERNLGQSAGGPSSTERNLGQSAGGPSSTERNLGQSAGGPSSTERNYYYTETRSTSSSTEEDLNIRKSHDSTVRKNTGPLKPFSNTKKPSLYKHLSKIHFSEKTRRYEWIRSDEDQVELYNDRSEVSKELSPACQKPPPACLEEQLVSRYLESDRAASTCSYGNKNSNNMQQYHQLHSAFTDTVSDRWGQQSYDSTTPSTKDIGFSESHQPAAGFSESHQPAAGSSQSHQPADPVIRRLEFDNLTLDESDVAACHLTVNMAAGVVSGTLIPGRDIPVRDVGHLTGDLLADATRNSSPAPLDCCPPHHPSSMSRAVDDYLSKTKAGQCQAKSTHLLPTNQFPLERKNLDTLTGSLRGEVTELPGRPNDSVFIPDQHHTKDSVFIPDQHHTKDSVFIPDQHHTKDSVFIPDQHHTKDSVFIPDQHHTKDSVFIPDYHHAATMDQTSSVIYPPINETNNKCTNNLPVLTPSLHVCERVIERSECVSNSCESVGHSETWSYQDPEDWSDQWSDQFSEKLSSFLADPADSNNQSASWTSEHKLTQMSPSSKLLKLLTDSQEMLRLLEESSAIPESIRVKVKAIGGHPLAKVPI